MQMKMNNNVAFHCSFLGFVFLGLIFCLLLLPCSSMNQFIFGDSLADAGNNDHLFTLSKADFSPYGIDFLPSSGQPTGRFTNGRTISDIVGQALGSKSLPPPFLAPNSEANTVETGINYASGSAGILSETGSTFIGRIPLQEQVDYFVQTRTYIVKRFGEKISMDIMKNALFSIVIGSNDVLNYIQPSTPFLGHDEQAIQPSIFQDIMISNLTMQLKRLKKLGARKFVVVGIGPLGCIPFVRAIKLVWFESCSNEVNEFIQGYNRKLKAVLRRMNEEMEGEAIFVYGNSYDIFMDIILNYFSYGFENAKDPCCGGYFPPFVCFKDKDKNTSSVLCEDRSKYVFWDSYHPTEAANLIIAKKLLDGDRTVAFPFNIRTLSSIII